MVLPNYTLSGLQLIIGKLMVYMHVMESSLTTESKAGRHLLQENWGLTRVDAGLKSVYIWVILTQKRLGTCKRLCKMQWLMLQQEEPEDFVIATGRMETVRKFIEISEKINE